MTYPHQLHLTLQTILRSFSALLLVASMIGCSDEPNDPSGSTGQQTPALGATKSDTAPLSLKVQVDLTAIRDQIVPDAKVFVFVREDGEKMPLGVEVFTVEDLPPTVEFSIQNGPSAVSVIARVSLTGKVERSAGDFEATANAILAHPAQIVDLSFAKENTIQPKEKSSNIGQIEVNIAMAVPAAELSKFSENSRVFIIAKAPGNPIPLAVKAYPVNAVPKYLVLSDNDAMMPSRPLSSVKTIEVSARISRSGNVSRAPGDWEGVATPPGSNNPTEYNIRIDKMIN